MEATLARTLVELEPLGPSYVSVTYGAGGSTRERTHDLVVQILRNTGMTPMAHLTCACHTRAELVDIVARYAEAGIENILALGGDPPKDLDLPDGELAYAVELVRWCAPPATSASASPPIPSRIRARRPGPTIAATPPRSSPKPTSPSPSSSRRRPLLRPRRRDARPRRRQAGDPRHHAGHEHCQREAHGRAPGLGVPRLLLAKLVSAGDDPAAVRAVGIAEATRLCATLLEGGAPGLHFYTMNRSTATVRSTRTSD